MCENSASVAHDDVERLCIIYCSRKVEPDFTPQRGLLHAREAQRVTSHLSDAREAMIVTSH